MIPRVPIDPTSLAMGRLQRSTVGHLARWRRRSHLGGGYIVGIAFRRSPHWLVIDPAKGEWGTMPDERFAGEFVASNAEARSLVNTISARRVGFRDAYRASMSA